MELISSSARSSRQSAYHRLALNSRANDSARSTFARLTAISSEFGESRKAGATRLREMSPQPIRPHLIFSISSAALDGGVPLNQEIRPTDPGLSAIPFVLLA